MNEKLLSKNRTIEHQTLYRQTSDKALISVDDKLQQLISNRKVFFYIYLLLNNLHHTKQKEETKNKAYTYVAQTNNRRNKHNIQEHVSKQYIC